MQYFAPSEYHSVNLHAQWNPVRQSNHIMVIIQLRDVEGTYYRVYMATKVTGLLKFNCFSDRHIYYYVMFIYIPFYFYHLFLKLQWLREVQKQLFYQTILISHTT